MLELTGRMLHRVALPGNKNNKPKWRFSMKKYALLALGLLVGYNAANAMTAAKKASRNPQEAAAIQKTKNVAEKEQKKVKHIARKTKANKNK